MSSLKVTLHLVQRRSTLHLLMIHIHIRHGANAVLDFHILLVPSDLTKYSLASDGDLCFLMTLINV